jgi:hypothetical protein
MSRAILIAALLLTGAVAEAAANDEMVIVMKSSGTPGKAGELFVFVGEHLSYRPLNLSCDNCWVFDSWYAARYRVAEWIHGAPPGPELEFDVAEHAVNVPFGHSGYALVFVEVLGEKMALVKYAQVPVYPTADGGFASCGPMGGAPREDGAPLDPKAPALRDIDFSPQLVVDDSRRMSAWGRARAYDPRWHEVIGNDVLCRRGVPVADLVSAMVRGDDLLKAALPDLAGAGK